MPDFRPNDDLIAPGLKADGDVDVFPLSELAERRAADKLRDAEFDEPDDFSDLGEIEELFASKKPEAEDAWSESEHPRGQPENAGEFSSGAGGSSKTSKPKVKKSESVGDLKKWFGSSKITDESGRPRVTYKAMQGDDPHLADTGMTHVALDPDVAKGFSNADRPVRRVYVKSDKPFDFRSEADLRWLVREMRKPKNVAAFNKDTKTIMGPDYDHEADADYIAAGLEDGAYQSYEIPAVYNLIKSKGYDGIYMVEQSEQFREPNLAVFSPDQLRVLAKDSDITADEWNEGDHPRGQPENAGQFATAGAGGSPIAQKWAQTGHQNNLTSKFDPAQHGDPTVYHGLKPGFERKGFGFVTKDPKAAAFHGNVGSFKIKPGASIYSDIESGLNRTGVETLIYPKPENSSGIVHFDDLVPTYSAGVKASGMAAALAQKTEWRKVAPDKIEAVLAAAPVHQAELAKVAEEIAKKIGIKFSNPGVKSENRIRQKIGRGKTPQQVNDAVRGGFDVKTPQEADAIVKELAKHFEVSDEGWGRTAVGYFDRKAMVRFPDGMIGEVQMWPPGMLETKEKKAHQLYEEWQKASPGPTKIQLAMAQTALFATVAAALPQGWHQINFAPA